MLFGSLLQNAVNDSFGQLYELIIFKNSRRYENSKKASDVLQIRQDNVRSDLKNVTYFRGRFYNQLSIQTDPIWMCPLLPYRPQPI
jgi:hypothetical protein